MTTCQFLYNLQFTYGRSVKKDISDHWYIEKAQLIVPKNILLTIYNTLILPHINYGLLVWGN